MLGRHGVGWRAQVQKKLFLNTVIRSCIENRHFLYMNGSMCRTLMPVAQLVHRKRGISIHDRR